jgi:hypothetical protein
MEDLFYCSNYTQTIKTDVSKRVVYDTILIYKVYPFLTEPFILLI